MAGDGTIRIHGACLDVDQSGQGSSAPADLEACTGSASQRWQPHDGALVNQASGKCLDDPRFSFTDGTPLGIYPCNGGANQRWSLP